MAISKIVALNKGNPTNSDGAKVATSINKIIDKIGTDDLIIKAEAIQLKGITQTVGAPSGFGDLKTVVNDLTSGAEVLAERVSDLESFQDGIEDGTGEIDGVSASSIASLRANLSATGGASNVNFGTVGGTPNASGTQVAEKVNNLLDLQVPNLKALASITPQEGATFYFGEYCTGSGFGGGPVKWDAAATHNGVTAFAPAAISAWNGTQAALSVIYDWSGEAGAWVRVNVSVINADMAGVIYNSSVDNTLALNKAISIVSALGGGSIPFYGIVFATQIILKRFVVLDGGDVQKSELKQIAGTNLDFIISENFEDLTGTGLSAGSSVLVPSFFGLANCRVNGNRYRASTNPSGNTSGRGASWYGPAQILRGIVLFYECAGEGLFTEYTITAGSSGWQGQEEGQFDNVIARGCGSDGWLYNGPHNSRLKAYWGGYNDGWGFRSIRTATSDGGLDQVDHLHTYANGRSETPALDIGVSLGDICRISALITDGDNLTIAGSGIQISNYRGYNLGGARDGLVITGNNNQIGTVNAVVWSSSVGRKGCHITGERNSITSMILATDEPDNDGLVVEGDETKISNLQVQQFSATGRKGIYLNANNCRINGEVTNCKEAFDYATSKQNNNVDLTIFTAAGQAAVSGSRPAVSDYFRIRSSGAVAGKLESSVQSAQFPLDITTVQNITIPHGLLYTPSREQVSVSILESSPTSTTHEMAFVRVASTDATNVVIGIKLAVAGPAGSLGRVGIKCSITG